MAQQALGEWELLQGSDDEWEDVGPGQESVELPTSQPAGPGAAEPAAAAVELPRVTPALQQVPAVQKLAPEVSGRRDALDPSLGNKFSALLVWCLATTFIQNRQLNVIHEAYFSRPPVRQHDPTAPLRRANAACAAASTSGGVCPWAADTVPASNVSARHVGPHHPLTIFWTVGAGAENSHHHNFLQNFSLSSQVPPPQTKKLPALPAAPARFMLPAPPGDAYVPYPLPPPCVLCAVGHVAACAHCVSRPLVAYMREQAELRSLAKLLIANAA